MLRRLVALNRDWSWRFGPQTLADNDIANTYTRMGTIMLSHPEVKRVVDIGAGKVWHFPPNYKDWYNIHLIGVDIDGDEMTDNHLLDEKITADAVQGIPVAPGSIDLIMARSGVEHFSDNQRFLDNAFAALRPGGYLLAYFPSRFALFAIINRLLPQSISKRVLQTTALESAEELGFKVYYDRTNYSAFRQMYARSGFKAIYHMPSFYNNFYFRFCLPLFYLSYVIDSVVGIVGNPRLAAHHIWILQKPGSNQNPQLYSYYGPPENP